MINSGTAPVKLSDITIKFWVYDTSGSPIVPHVWTGGCLTDSHGCFHQVSGVSPKAKPFSPGCGPYGTSRANWEITISNSDSTLLSPNVAWTNLQTALNLGNYANFTPGTSHWYSPCLSGSGYQADSHYSVYYKGNLVLPSGEQALRDPYCICHAGYVGPGEQCPNPSKPPVPGPFGDFSCLLEGTNAANKLTLRTGATTEEWQLRGTLKFSLEATNATLTNASVEGFASPNLATNDVFLLRDRGVAGAGTVDLNTGAIQADLPFLLIRQNQPDSALKMSLTGTVTDHILQGVAHAAVPPGGATTADLKIFCREQFLDAFVAASYQFDAAGKISLGETYVAQGSPAIPALRHAMEAGDFLFETRSKTNEVLDQFVVKRPIPMRGEATAGVTMFLTVPLSNRIQTILLRNISGQIVAIRDLSSPIASFCAADGSQYCDYVAGGPLRKVLYAPNTPPPALGLDPPPPGGTGVVAPLPSSSRIVQGELTVATTPDDRQPSVALDADGNAVVVWRRDYQDIMMTGIANDNTVSFGPVVVNDTFCAIAWLPPPGPTPPPRSKNMQPSSLHVRWLHGVREDSPTGHRTAHLL